MLKKIFNITSYINYLFCFYELNVNTSERMFGCQMRNQLFGSLWWYERMILKNNLRILVNDSEQYPSITVKENV